MTYSFDLVNTKAKKQDAFCISRQILLFYYLRKILKRLIEKVRLVKSSQATMIQSR